MIYEELVSEIKVAAKEELSIHTHKKTTLKHSLFMNDERFDTFMDSPWDLPLTFIVAENLGLDFHEIFTQ